MPADELTVEGETREVVGSKGDLYYVSYEDGHPVACTCPDHIYRQRACTHMGAYRSTYRPTTRGRTRRYVPQQHEPGLWERLRETGSTSHDAAVLWVGGFFLIGVGVLLAFFVPVLGPMLGAVFIVIGIVCLWAARRIHRRSE